jgi:hypothetical protein
LFLVSCFSSLSLSFTSSPCVYLRERTIAAVGTQPLSRHCWQVLGSLSADEVKHWSRHTRS